MRMDVRKDEGLEGKESMNPNMKAVQAVVQAARQSPCQKSKRGAAIVGGDGTIVAAWNALPKPFACDGSEACRRDCARRCVHAEEQALLISAATRLTKPCEVIHIKVVRPDVVIEEPVEPPAILAKGASKRVFGKPINGQVPGKANEDYAPVPSGPPSCIECAKLMLAVGVHAVWLLHEHGWQRYPMEEFYRLTLKELGLKED